MAALAMAAGCSSSGDTSGGKPNGIEGQSVDRIFARVDKALDAASVHTVQVADGRQVGDVHALHGGDDCTGLFTDDQGFAWHFTTLGEHTWITPERRGAKLVDRTGAPVEPGRYLPVELDSPGFAGELARHSSAACHLRFSHGEAAARRLHEGGRDPRERAAGPGGEDQARQRGGHRISRDHR
ncbi:hypothetical protein ABZZ36_34105 [Actinacidiphila glaucinigra]|uniref:hypothetical protein n=1 Tax=Actinacidiphila glaucinigra TaxID=235986 RepID=UPI0033B9E02E